MSSNSVSVDSQFDTTFYWVEWQLEGEGSFVSSWTDGDVTGDGQVDVLNDAFALVANLGADRLNP